MKTYEQDELDRRRALSLFNRYIYEDPGVTFEKVLMAVLRAAETEAGQEEIAWRQLGSRAVVVLDPDSQYITTDNRGDSKRVIADVHYTIDPQLGGTHGVLPRSGGDTAEEIAKRDEGIIVPEIELPVVPEISDLVGAVVLDRPMGIEFDLTRTSASHVMALQFEQKVALRAFIGLNTLITPSDIVPNLR